jgi:hypothetical protein
LLGGAAWAWLHRDKLSLQPLIENERLQNEVNRLVTENERLRRKSEIEESHVDVGPQTEAEAACVDVGSQQEADSFEDSSSKVIENEQLRRETEIEESHEEVNRFLIENEERS